jgi:release factor glutamine methyltransferase
MKVSSNKISDIKAFMHSFLNDLYPADEISSFFYILMEFYCGLSRVQLHAGRRETVNESELLLVYDAIKDLSQGKPVQYITGEAWFCGLQFSVNHYVLIPRPETEELVNLTINDNKHMAGLNILDIGTGSGCIAIALKKHLKDARVYAVDISEAALSIARQNAGFHHSDITFIHKDILTEDYLSGLPHPDIVVSNPPYVPESEQAIMHKNVLDFEPYQAIFVKNDDALMYYEAILRRFCHTNKRCSMYFEINEKMGAELIMLAKEFGITDICIRKDMNEKERFLIVYNH